MTPTFLKNTISLANAFSLIRMSVEKVGLEYIAPLDPAIQAEKISKALTETTRANLVKETK